MSRSGWGSGLLKVCLMMLLFAPGTARGSETWPGLRGPSFDGAVRDGRLLPADGGGLSVAWKHDLGSGYSVVAVGEGRAFTLFAAGERDVIAAFDAASGEELWRQPLGPAYAGHSGSHDGPIASPVLGDGKVFALGPRGKLLAAQAADGREIWSRDLAEDLGGEVPYYGFGASPVYVDGVLVVALGGEGKAIVGLDAGSGKLLWSLGDGAVEYNSPILAELAGRRQVVTADSKHLYGLDPGSGEELWRYEHGADPSAKGGATLVPLPAGKDRLLLLHKGDASLMLELALGPDGPRARELWSSRGISNTYVQPVYHGGYLYGMRGTIFTCVDAATGETVWRSRAPGDGFPTLVGDQLAILTKAGTLHVAEASPEGYRELARLDLFEDHSWSAVAFAGGGLYARSMGEIARIEAVGDPAAVDPAAAAAEDAGVPGWLAATDFGRLLDRLPQEEDPAAVLEAYLEAREPLPLVEDGGVVHFIYRSPAVDVGIVSDRIGDRREDPMTAIPGTDAFYYSTRLEPDAAVAYGFIPAFGEVEVDPRNPRRGGSIFGEVSWLAMPAWEGPVFDSGTAPPEEGRREVLEWQVPAEEGAEDPAPVKRRVEVYLPAGYGDEPQRSYPVVYVLGGDDALRDGRTAEVLDRVLGSRVEPLIAVFVLPVAESSAPDFRRPKAFAKAVADHLVPRVDERYRTDPRPVRRAVAGAGGGGRTALLFAFWHPETFGKVASLGAPFLNLSELADEVGFADQAPLVIYLSWGVYHIRGPHEGWDMGDNNRRLFLLLRERGYRPTGGETADGFGWFAWRARTDDWLRALFPLPTGP